ncbi:MAG: PAS domain S-box protein, partial [Leptospirales bacterium]
MMLQSVASARILLVEDNPADARLIAEHLDDAARESGGMESDGRELNIVHAKSLNEATEFFRDGPFNIVLVDLTLPESSGMNTVRRAKALFEDCPLIVLTGYDDTRFALDALKLGAQDYLIKGHETGLSILRAILYALERQRMVNSIESSQRRYRSLIDSSPNAIYLLEDFRILLSNRAGLRLLGVEDEAALIGRCIFDFLDPETPREETRRQMEESAARETATPTERSYRMLTGRTVPVEDMVSRIAGDPNGPDQLLVVATDISEKKRIEDHLIHSRRMATMGELAAGIAHEISQPLNVIRIAAGMVADSIATKENDPEFVGERADKILAQVQRASKVINHL